MLLDRLGFCIEPINRVDNRWRLIVSTQDGAKTIGIFSREEIKAFAAKLEAEATTLRVTSCALLHKTKMTINNE